MRLDQLPKGLLALNPHLFTAAEPYIMPEPPSHKADERAEKELQRLAGLELRRRGIWHLHLSPRAREKVGCPDIIACVGAGRFFGCELKTHVGRVSDAQRANLEHIADCGGKAAVVRSMTEFIELLDEIGGLGAGDESMLDTANTRRV